MKSFIDEFLPIASGPLIVAGMFVVLTTVAWKLMHPSLREEFKLWMMGKRANEWSAQFCNLFDAFFGTRHFSLKCFIRSSIISIIFVCLLWLMIGNNESFVRRTGSEIPFMNLLVFALIINVTADFISLLETRYLLVYMARYNKWYIQLLILIIDLVLTGVIFFAVLWCANQLLSIFGFSLDVDVGTTLGALSETSLFFYSTFITSIWLWGFALSDLVLKFFSKIKATNILDLENSPSSVFSTIGGVTIVIFGLILQPSLKEDQHGLNIIERNICKFSTGVHCNTKLAELVKDHVEKLKIMQPVCLNEINYKMCIKRYLKRFEISEASAFKFYSERCSSGSNIDCLYMAISLEDGTGIEQNVSGAKRLYEKACKRNEFTACSYLGWLYYKGKSVEQDYAKAKHLFEDACKNKDGLGCLRLGFMYERGGGVDKDYAKAKHHYEEACEKDVFTGCSNLGWLYYEGKGVEQDYAKAKHLYEEACENENEYGCANLGWLYYEGKGVEQDYVKAKRLLEEACGNDSGTGCSRLGLMYYIGRGVERDFVKASQIYEKACENENGYGCYNLGVLYSKGHGVERDYDKASQLLEKACKLDESLCQ